MLQRILGGKSAGAEVSVEEAYRRQQAGAVVIDVRASAEWADGHVPGARHIPLGQISRRAAALPADRDICVICHSGNRSARATADLRRLGYGRAVNVRGGMLDWERASLPVVRA